MGKNSLPGRDMRGYDWSLRREGLRGIGYRADIFSKSYPEAFFLSGAAKSHIGREINLRLPAMMVSRSIATGRATPSARLSAITGIARIRSGIGNPIINVGRCSGIIGATPKHLF